MLGHGMLVAGLLVTSIESRSSGEPATPAQYLITTAFPPDKPALISLDQHLGWIF